MSAHARTWMDDVKAHGLEAVAHAFNIQVVRGHGSHRALSPCPACGADKRGSTDNAGAAGLTRDGSGWHCFRCDATGDAIALAAWMTLRTDRPIRSDWGKVREECTRRGLCAVPGAMRAAPNLVPANPPPVPAAAPAKRPHHDEVHALWERAGRVDEDEEVSAWLGGMRKIDAAAVADRNLARVIRTDERVPRWAWFKGQLTSGNHWPALGYRCVFPLYDDAGHMVSVRARRVFASSELAPTDGCPKSLPPSGYAIRGLVLADTLGRLMLSGAPLGDGTPAALWLASLPVGVVLVEGEPDFLTATLSYSDADKRAPAVIGIVEGAWTDALAARIPDGCTICIATDLDAKGDKFKDRIVGTFAPRMRAGLLRVKRWTGKKGSHG